jgi:2'-5' RNA ligase
MADRYRPGQTALLAVVPEAEPVVGHWRRRFDTSAAAGVPAHVTVLYPFLDIDAIGTAEMDDLRALAGARGSFEVRFAECRRFPEVLYLAPEPDQPFRELTQAVAARWPQAPPYGGQFAEVIPHLTVAHDQPSAVYEELAATIPDQLPVTAVIASVTLFVTDGRRWRPHTDLRLG